MDTELKPCPFCGEEAGICEANDICFHRDDDGNKIFGGWRCFCPSCAIEQVGYETREEAVSAWNNRSTEHATHRAPVDEKGGGRMTGIERLRRLARSQNMDNAWTAMLAHELCDIADQIEREHAEDCYKMGLNHGTVSRVIADMERHILGHEGMEDSPVARWARELREALGGDGRDPAADVSVSAYDLLPDEERDAIAWVREHGGLGEVREEWKRRSNLKRMCEKAQAKVERQQRHIEHVQGVCKTRAHRIVELNKTVAEMRRRLMPEGMADMSVRDLANLLEEVDSDD